MTKIITENFKAETTSELYDSFEDINQDIVATFKLSLESLNTLWQTDGDENTNFLVNDPDPSVSDQIDDVADLVNVAVNQYKPESVYYIMASTNEEQPAITNTQVSVRNFLRKVIFGAKVDNNSVRYMFPLQPWQKDKVYDSFDDTKDVSQQDMFAVVLDGTGIVNEAPYKVYKCIRNNGGSPSTIAPSTSSASESVILVEDFEVTLADGYVWKFMFEVSPSEYIIYGTETLLPLPYPGDPSVIAAAKESISDILIEGDTPADLFKNYTAVSTDSDGGLQMASVNVANDIKVARLFYPTTTGTIYMEEDSYRDMLFVTPDGKVYDIVKSRNVYDATLARNVLEVELLNEGLRDESNVVTLDLLENATALYSIVPKIQVSRSSGETCVAYAKLDTSGKIIDIVITDGGTEYKYAEAAVVTPKNLTNALAASGATAETTLRCIVSPRGGHGSNPIKEMAMSRLGIVTVFSGVYDEVPDTNTYTQVGLVKNPVFASGSFPIRFDNRTFIRLNGDYSGFTAQNQYIVQEIFDQDVLIETVTAQVHEFNVVTISGQTYTDLYVVNYDGAFRNKFTPGASVKLKTTLDATQFQQATINSQTTSVVYGDYSAYSGDLLHYVDFDAIQRRVDRQEKIKFIFDF